ncbi:unnamed protein product [Heligmosomoides polygyrus]|uniref:Uncharacterized protein n=1 Tax=Heligmosomoides polygyrus TaxID=6339 RepID=A0A3P8BUZ2_HELPZ|nr:unnamed protein product [Heligmosomoides polygyrus]
MDIIQRKGLQNNSEATILYGCECWALSSAESLADKALPTPGVAAARCGKRMLRAVMKTAPIQLKMREQRTRWYGPIFSKPENRPIGLALDFEAPRKRPGYAPRKRWKDAIKRDLAEVDATPHDARDRMRWRRITRTADPTTAGLSAHEESSA